VQLAGRFLLTCPGCRKLLFIIADKARARGEYIKRVSVWWETRGKAGGWCCPALPLVGWCSPSLHHTRTPQCVCVRVCVRECCNMWWEVFDRQKRRTDRLTEMWCLASWCLEHVDGRRDSHKRPQLSRDSHKRPPHYIIQTQSPNLLTDIGMNSSWK
jgi:hypothetical protein